MELRWQTSFSVACGTLFLRSIYSQNRDLATHVEAAPRPQLTAGQGRRVISRTAPVTEVSPRKSHLIAHDLQARWTLGGSLAVFPEYVVHLVVGRRRHTQHFCVAVFQGVFATVPTNRAYPLFKLNPGRGPRDHRRCSDAGRESGGESYKEDVTEACVASSCLSSLLVGDVEIKPFGSTNFVIYPRRGATAARNLGSLPEGYNIRDMSRFIKYASNLLDGVDSMAKDSLTDQGVFSCSRRKHRQSSETSRRCWGLSRYRVYATAHGDLLEGGAFTLSIGSVA